MAHLICYSIIMGPIRFFLPGAHSMLKPALLPIVKNKNKRSNDSTNYRPICISNVICKIIEKVIHKYNIFIINYTYYG